MRRLRLSMLMLVFAGALSPSAGRALELCSHSFGGGDCGNGVMTCNAGYTIACRFNCQMDGGCSSICDGCNCIPGYKPANFETIAGSGGSKTIIAYCDCRQVTNNLSKTIFIPLKTSTEWSTFIANKPAGVSANPASCE